MTTLRNDALAPALLDLLNRSNALEIRIACTEVALRGVTAPTYNIISKASWSEETKRGDDARRFSHVSAAYSCRHDLGIRINNAPVMPLVLALDSLIADIS